MIREGSKIQTMFQKNIFGLARANHILIFNLSIADSLLGFYLLSLGIYGAKLSGVFCQHLLEWCSSATCEALGSLAVFSSEAAVLTMVLLTSFRLYSVFNVSRSFELDPNQLHFCKAFLTTA